MSTVKLGITGNALKWWPMIDFNAGDGSLTNTEIQAGEFESRKLMSQNYNSTLIAGFVYNNSTFNPNPHGFMITDLTIEIDGVSKILKPISDTKSSVYLTNGESITPTKSLVITDVNIKYPVIWDSSGARINMFNSHSIVYAKSNGDNQPISRLILPNDEIYAQNNNTTKGLYFEITPESGYDLTSVSISGNASGNGNIPITGNKATTPIIVAAKPSTNGNNNSVQLFATSTLPQPVTHRLAQTLSHATSSLTGSTIVDGKQDVTITAEVNTETPYTLYDISYKIGLNGPKVQVLGNKSDTPVTFTIDATDDVYITAKAQYYAPTRQIPITKNLTNCTTDAPNTFPENSKLTITVTANDGLAFQVNATVTINNVGTSPNVIKPFLLNEDSTSGTVTIDEFESGSDSDAYVIINATATSQISNVQGFSNLYKMTNTTLDSLSRERFNKETLIIGSSPDVITTVNDYGKNISSLSVYPFELPESVVGDDNNIQLGSHQSTTVAPFITTNQIKIDVGSITVPLVYNDFNDYQGTVVLYLPFVNAINLNINDVMGKTVSVNMIVNLFNRKTTINIIVDGFIIDTSNDTIGSELPFILGENNSVSGSVNSELINTIRKAYITIRRPKPVSDPQGYDTLEQGELDGLTGYVECSNINLESMATVSEQEDIQLLLQRGVYINA